MLDLQWTENLERSDWGAFTRSVDSAAAPNSLWLNPLRSRRRWQ